MMHTLPDDFFQHNAVLFAVLNQQIHFVQVSGAWETHLQLREAEVLQTAFVEWMAAHEQVLITQKFAQLQAGTSSQINFNCTWQVKQTAYLLQWVISNTPHQQFYAVATLLKTEKFPQDFFYALFQHNPDLIVVKDSGQHYVFCNQAFCHFTGFTESRLLGCTVSELCTSEQVKHIVAQDELVLKTNKPHVGEIYLEDRHGKTHYFISKKFLYPSPVTNTAFIVSFYHEFTSYKLFDKALRAREERFELAIQGSQHGLWDWDLRTNEIYLSPRWKSLLGYEDAEIPNHLDALCQYVHPDDFMQMWGDIEAYLDKRVARYESIYRMRHKNGDDCWVLARAAALWDTDEHPYRMVGTYVDITERKNIERALFESQALLAAIFDVTPIGLCVTDEQGHFTRVNQAFCELYGYSADELLKSCFTILFPSEQPTDITELHQTLLEHTKTDLTPEWTVQHKSKQLMQVLITSGQLQLPDNSTLHITTTTDITQRKRNDEERNRLFNLSVDMQSIVNFEGCFTELNPAWEHTLGWRKAIFLESSFLEFVHPADMQITLSTFARLKQGEIVLNFENRYRCKYGGYRWLSWNSYPLIDQRSIYSITRDVSSYKHAQEQIAQQQHFIRVVVDNIPSLIFIKDNLGNFIFANQAVADLLGTDLDTLLNHTKSELNHPLENTENYPSKPDFVSGEQIISSESLCTTAKGEERCYHLIKKPFLYDDGDVLVLTVGTDITERYSLERRLKDTIAELEIILNSSVIGIAYVKDQHFVRVNHKLSNLLGYASENLLQLPIQSLFVDQSAYQTLLSQAKIVLSAGKEYDSGHWLYRQDQSSFYSRIVGKAVDAQDLEKGSIWMFEDTTLQSQAGRNLNLMRTVFESTADGILITDLDCVIRKVNPAMSKITGYDSEELYGKKTSYLSSGRHNKEYYQKMWESIIQTGHWQGEIWNRRKQGEAYVAWLSISAIMDEEQRPVQYMAVLSDISRLQADIEKNRYLANYDYLTNLPNRVLFYNQLTQSQIWAKRHHRLFAVFFIDLDGFKKVNDDYGHATGDLLLQYAAERLKNSIRETDMVARLGGDEFTVLLTEVSHLSSVENVARKILNQLEQVFELEGYVVNISASIGIAIYPEHSHDLDTLMNYADIAMYYAKAQGKGTFFFYDEVPSDFRHEPSP